MAGLDVVASVSRFLAPSAPYRRKWWTGPGRLRPVQLKRAGAGLREGLYLAGACRLLGEYFPEALHKYRDVSIAGWPDVMDELYRLIEEAGWFEVKSELWKWLGEPPLPPFSPKLPDYFLLYPPVRLYGWGANILDYPPLRLLEMMLDGAITDDLRGDLLNMVGDAGLYGGGTLHDILASWAEVDELAAWARLKEIEEDPAPYPEPLRCLPEFSRWVCHQTGNPILDHGNEEQTYGFQTFWTWADLPEIRQCWRQARPAIDKLRQLIEWYEAGGGRLSKIAAILIDGNPEILETVSTRPAPVHRQRRLWDA